MLVRNFYFQDPSVWHCLVFSSVAMQGTVCENPKEGIPYFQHSQGHIAVLELDNLEKPISLSDAAQRGADQALHEEQELMFVLLTGCQAMAVYLS